MSFELIVVVIVFVMIFNITIKMQKKIEIDRINSMIQKAFLYFIIEQNDISARQNKMIIEHVNENFDDEFYVESIEHHEIFFQNQLNQFRQSIQNRINHYISVYIVSIFFYVDFQFIEQISASFEKIIKMFENIDDDDFSSFHYNFFHLDFHYNFHHDFHHDFHYNFQYNNDVFISFYNDSFENSFEKSFEKYEFERQFNQYANVSMIINDQLVENKFSTFYDKKRNHAKFHD